MKIVFLLLFTLGLTNTALAQTAPWSKSPALEALIVELKQHYAADDLFEIDKQNLQRVDNLSYFIRFIDKPDAPEYPLLKAYLWGMQDAHISSVNQQIQTNIIPWFCPPGKLLGKRYNDTQFIENIIWESLERTIKTEPDWLKQYDGATAFSPISGRIMYGLQTKYPCYEKIPERHRLPGVVY
ncbi:hypothetical protein [Vibrio maritimus]|uniref:hypothetical protein n=1 Tax=Vibrio maritimus TaxID=990268 RepID=UPI0040695A31